MSENEIPADIKAWIDSACYEDLLRKWRAAPAGSPYFQGAAGDYYSEVMKKAREEVGTMEHVRASKAIGW